MRAWQIKTRGNIDHWHKLFQNIESGIGSIQSAIADVIVCASCVM